MANEHWFDMLNRVVVRNAPRREVMRAVGALAVGLLFGGAPIAAAGKKKRKKDKCPNCGVAKCLFFPTERAQCACQRKCTKCRIRSQFCILGPDADHDDWHATCCFEDQTCCGFECVDTKSHTSHCGGCFNPPCQSGQRCVDGECRCPENASTLCDGVCRDLDSDERHCGACDAPPCQYPQANCCGGACVNVRENPNHCGWCGRSCDPGQGCCAGACYDSGSYVCCTGGEGIDRVCPIDKGCCTDGAWVRCCE